MKQRKEIHRPGSLMDRRPLPAGSLARLDRLNWQANPERYARQAWAQINRWAEG